MFFSSFKTFAQWSLTGNTSTNPPTNYLGTTDAKDLVIKTNATEKVRVTTNGTVGIGTTAPRATLDIVRQCSTGNLAGILMEQDVLAPTCSTGLTRGTDYLVVRSFNSFTSAYQHFFYVNGSGKVAIGNNSATTQLEVQAIGSTDPFQVKNSSGTQLFKILSSTGNAAIGNVTPTYRLDVNCQQTGAGQPPFRFVNYAGNTSMIATNNDRVGINVTNPDTYGGSLVVGAIGTGANAFDLVSTATTGWCNQIRFFNASGPRHIIYEDRTTNSLVIDAGYGSGGTDTLKIAGNAYITGVTNMDGRLRIGSKTITSGTHADAKLFVQGKVAAQSFVVTVSNWADHVFNSDYKLRSLPELENYITENHHLPEVPNECDVLDNGVNMSEMNTTLLKKVEELTLYTIALQKQMDKLNKELNALTNR